MLHLENKEGKEKKGSYCTFIEHYKNNRLRVVAPKLWTSMGVQLQGIHESLCTTRIIFRKNMSCAFSVHSTVQMQKKVTVI